MQVPGTKPAHHALQGHPEAPHIMQESSEMMESLLARSTSHKLAIANKNACKVIAHWRTQVKYE
jgi:hypothetical protein